MTMNDLGLGGGLGWRQSRQPSPPPLGMRKSLSF